jgi:hypothetical protein
MRTSEVGPSGSGGQRPVQAPPRAAAAPTRTPARLPAAAGRRCAWLAAATGMRAALCPLAALPWPCSNPPRARAPAPTPPPCRPRPPAPPAELAEETAEAAWRSESAVRAFIGASKRREPLVRRAGARERETRRPGPARPGPARPGPARPRSPRRCARWAGLWGGGVWLTLHAAAEWRRRRGR